MNTILMILAIGGFIWLTFSDLKYRFITGIVLGVILIFFGDGFVPDGYAPTYGVLLIIFCTLWLLFYQSVEKQSKGKKRKK